ncbi:Histidine kinase [Amycolatopsis xylanica]|uniref:histidine kinase n=1 Tax=Amycolatopsis xylanica TaxID=589385 RepID=A0A1H3FXJ7_9PSEU|nr:ATP-binding protein [Amycolatopsis xylanica]SDX94849.1 Histidine kinase [Amycolatopsis xylanica]
MTVNAAGQRWWAGAAALAVFAWTMAVSWPADGSLWWQEFPPRVVGVVVIVAGLVVWVRLPSPRIGALMVFGAAVYYLQYLRSADGVLFAVGFCLAYAWMGVAAHVLMTWPTGRLSGRVDWGYVVASYVISIGTQVARYFVDHPTPPWGIGIAKPVTFWGTLGSALGAVMGIGATGIVLWRWLSTAKLRRRPTGPVWLGFIAAASFKIAEAVATVLTTSLAVKTALAWLFTIAVIVMVPLLYLVRWVLRKLAPEVLVNLLVDIKRDYTAFADPAALQHTLSKGLDDPTLTIKYTLDSGELVDIHGRRVFAGAGSTTEVRRRDRLIAVIEHDPALDAQPKVMDAAVAAVGLAIDNARMYATLQAQLEQLRASRRQLAQTAATERQRIQRDLHDETQARFFRILMLLDTAEHEHPSAAVRRAHTELTDAVRTMRQLTQGIYPTVLRDHGLTAAVENLADRAALPVTFAVSPRRWPEEVEVTAYFVISEALANVYKHAKATEAGVRVQAEPGQLVVEVTDNGRGGASALNGLRARAEAVNGRLTFVSPPGHGTTVRAVIPGEALCES